MDPSLLKKRTANRGCAWESVDLGKSSETEEHNRRDRKCNLRVP